MVVYKVYATATSTTASQTTLDVYDTTAAHGGRLLSQKDYTGDQSSGTTATAVNTKRRKGVIRNLTEIVDLGSLCECQEHRARWKAGESIMC